MITGTAVSFVMGDEVLRLRVIQPLNVVAFNLCSRQYAACVIPDVCQVLTCWSQSALLIKDLNLDMLCSPKLIRSGECMKLITVHRWCRWTVTLVKLNGCFISKILDVLYSIH